MALTYLEFHLLFLFPPMAALVVATVVRRRPDRRRLHAAGVAVIVALAFAYTVPWDNYLIAREVWWYGEGRIAGRVWLAPLGEYLFILAQPVGVALWLFQFDTAPRRVETDRADAVVGLAAGGLVTALGLLFVGADSTFYLGAILAWAGPVLALQWGVGWRYLWAVRRRVAVGVGVPTLYLWIADRIAIGDGIWIISDRHTTGLELVGLPIEEATFFLVTTLFVVQGLVLLPWVVRRWG